MDMKMITVQYLEDGEVSLSGLHLLNSIKNYLEKDLLMHMMQLMM